MGGYIDEATQRQLDKLAQSQRVAQEIHSEKVRVVVRSFKKREHSRRGNISKRSPYGRILKTEYRDDGREWQLHATKGWRSHKVQPQ